MAGRDILLLEDEAIIAMDMEMTLEANGYSVLGPFGSLKQARAAITEARPAVAVLDVNLGKGETSFAFAEELAEKGIPVVFLSGYSTEVLPMPEGLQAACRGPMISI